MSSLRDKGTYQTILRAAFRFFRTKRIRAVYERFGITARTRILDVGGSTVFWKLAADSHLPVPEVTIINVKPCAETLPRKTRWIVADASKLPFPDQSFDFVFCNSVIEHISLEKRERVAAEIMRLAPRFFVQTPNRWFPLDPHFMTPFIHWIPLKIRPKIVRWFTVWSWILRPSEKQCEDLVRSIRLLNKTDLRRLFPNATIASERFFGLSKSIAAIKRADLPTLTAKSYSSSQLSSRNTSFTRAAGALRKTD